MPFDGMLLNQTVNLLQPLSGAKIGKIQSLSEDEIVFSLHRAGLGLRRLAVSVHSNTCRLYLAGHLQKTQAEPGPFVMLLRKRLSQGYITEIEQIDFDRIVRFHISACDELADRIEYDLYAEMMGKYANLILVDSASSVIIDCLKRIPVFENSRRLLHPGALYSLPERPKRYSPLHPGPLDLHKSLVSQIEGFSPSLSREFLYRMQQGQSYESVLKELQSSRTLYRYGRDFHILPLLHLGENPQTFPLMEGLERLFEADEIRRRMNEQYGDVFRAVDREIRRLSKKLPKLEEALEQSQDYDRWRQYGDVLFANLETERRPVVALPSFEEEGVMLQIPLDMRYSVKDNANLFYKKYHKLKRGILALEEQLEEACSQLEYFQTLQEQLKYCTAQDIAEIRQELIDARVLRAKSAAKKKQSRRPNLIEIPLEGGGRILAGKNNLQNQFITWKLARRNDLWFHVQGYHGSHVVLQSDHPTEQQIRLCAMLAAWFSKSRFSSSVPIDYTRISNLKKIPKKGPGFVSMKSYQTIYIDPEREKIEQVLSEGRVPKDMQF